MSMWNLISLILRFLKITKFNSRESAYILVSTSSDICSTAGPQTLIATNIQLPQKANINSYKFKWIYSTYYM